MGNELEPKVLLLQSTKPLELQGLEKNHVKQMYVPGKGEIVARFNNLEKEKKYFVFLIEETDAEGNPLHRTVTPAQASDNNGETDLSKSISKKILKLVEECNQAIGTNEEGPADPGQVLLTIQSKLAAIEALLAK